MQSQCYYCGVYETKLFRCSQCKITWYCSFAHQKLDWKQHRPICKEIVKNQLAPQKDNAPTNASVIDSYKSKTKTSLPYNLQYDEYEIAPSPIAPKQMPESSSQEQEFQAKNRVHKFADQLIENLTKKGYCIIDGFLGDEKGEKVLCDVKKILKAGIMKDGQLVGTNNTNNSSQTKVVRGDKITWITGHEEQYDSMKIIIDTVDRLIRYAKYGLQEYTIKGRTPAMVACYPGDGSGYKRHIDNTQKDGRLITCLYYLNKGWDGKVNGGQLRIFPFAGQESVNIEPIFDRLFVFWSDKRSPHEVLPAFAERFAITLWYFDAIEREAVKEAYMTQLQQAFAGSSVEQQRKS